MTVERPPSAVLSEAAMFGAFVGVVAMMAVMVAGGSGFLVAGLWGVLFGLAAFAALLILLPKTAAAEVVEDLVAPVTPLAESETGDVVGGAGDAGAATDSVGTLGRHVRRAWAVPGRVLGVLAHLDPLDPGAIAGLLPNQLIGVVEDQLRRGFHPHVG